MTPNRLVMQCAPGFVINDIQFASYGTPTGSCGGYEPGSCNAPNSSAVVSTACLDKNSCTVWPNTSTFGDECFGTVKELIVQFTCSGGPPGQAQCFTGPPPAPVTNVSVTVSVDFSQPTVTVSTLPSLQVVSQRLLLPWSGSIYTTAWSSLAHLTSLGLKAVRYVPWIPYAKMGVAELDPPTGELLCGPHMWTFGQVYPFTLDCGVDGGTITAIDFASFGNAKGVCGSYTKGSCEDANSAAIVQAACVGKQACTLGPADFSPSTCSGTGTKPYLAVQARCSNGSARFTYWNFSTIDQLTGDFWAAVDGDTTQPIPNFSTQPTWLYSPGDFTYPDDPTVAWYGYDRGTAPAANLTALGDYYGRLLAWYTQGGFTDEYGAYKPSPHHYNLTYYEIFNEVDYEHGHTAESYTVEYDAVVAGIRRWTGETGKGMRFVALSLPNIDNTGTVESFVSYFLNQSNHNPAVWDAVSGGLLGIHAYPTSSFGPWSADPSSFAGMFAYVDDYVDNKVAGVASLIAASHAPDVKLALDESGVDMDGVLSGGPNPPGDNPRFWVAGGGYWAYLWARASALGDLVYVVGQSQLMDAPGQEPSVSILDWTTGLGTAKYWVMELLLRNSARGDVFVSTGVSNTTVLHAQGFTHTSASTGQSSNSLLLISKANVNVNATVTVEWQAAGRVSGMGGEGGKGAGAGAAAAAAPEAASSCTAECVDETTGLGPARAVPCSIVTAGGDGGSSSGSSGGSGAGAAQVQAQVAILPYATCILQLLQ